MHEGNIRKVITVNKTYKPSVTCTITYEFNYGSVSNNLKDRPISNPSSNRPEFCGVCQECLWTYDMELHYDSKHSGVECPENFLISVDEREKVLNLSVNLVYLR